MTQDVKLVDKEYVGLHYPIINLGGCIYWPNHSLCSFHSHIYSESFKQQRVSKNFSMEILTKFIIKVSLKEVIKNQLILLLQLKNNSLMN